MSSELRPEDIQSKPVSLPYVCLHPQAKVWCTCSNCNSPKDTIPLSYVRSSTTQRLVIQNPSSTLSLSKSQDTMSVMSSHILLMLGIHGDVQEKVRNEISDIAGKEEITADLLPHLKYLEMVVKETLRLFPIAPMMARHLKADLQLDECVIPGGCEVILLPFVTQRNPQYWKDPEKFIPERFTLEETAKRHPYTFIPFSAGLMNCIGQKFAMTCLKTITANVIRSYKITSTTRMEDIKLKMDISIRSVHGYNISLQSL